MNKVSTIKPYIRNNRRVNVDPFPLAAKLTTLAHNMFVLERKLSSVLIPLLFLLALVVGQRLWSDACASHQLTFEVARKFCDGRIVE